MKSFVPIGSGRKLLVGIIGAAPLGVISTRNWKDLTWTLVCRFATTGTTIVAPMPPKMGPSALGGVPILLALTETPLTVTLALVPMKAFTRKAVKSLVELNQWMKPTLAGMLTDGVLV